MGKNHLPLDNGILGQATQQVPIATGYTIDNAQRLVVVQSRHPLETAQRHVAIPWAIIKLWAASIVMAEAQAELQAAGVVTGGPPAPPIGHE